MLQVELHIPNAQSLKERRAVLNSLKDQLRSRFNISVAQLESDEKWQRAMIGVSTVGDDRIHVQGSLRRVVEWLRMSRLIELIRIEEDYL